MIRIASGIAIVALTLLGARLSGTVDLIRFPLCWAGVLVALDGLARVRRGSSPLRTAPDWIATALASVVFWDVFELVDLRLKNWWYAGVSPSPWVSAAFGAVSFATVLPAVRLLLFVARDPAAVVQRQRRPALLLALGGVLLALALLFPRYAFALAWVFLWPLCEALASLLQRRALATPLESRAFVRVAALGIPLGLLWESLNWQCRRGWVYTVPFFERWKLFEMPLPGYLGYLPFLLEAAAALALLDRLRPHLRGVRGALAALAVIALHAGADQLSRRQTVVSFAPYDESGVAPPVLELEQRTHMGLPRAEQVVRLGWGSLQDPPALVRLWQGKARAP